MEKEISVVLDSVHNQLVVSSLQIAEDFGKNHRDVLRSIENLVAQLRSQIFVLRNHLRK